MSSVIAYKNGKKKQWGRSMIKENAYKEGEQEKTSCCRRFANEH